MNKELTEIDRYVEVLTKRRGSRNQDTPTFSLSSWARWIAADPNGVWCEYDEEPDCDIDSWIPKGRWGVLGVTDSQEVHWSKTLTVVNQHCLV